MLLDKENDLPWPGLDSTDWKCSVPCGITLDGKMPVCRRLFRRGLISVSEDLIVLTICGFVCRCSFWLSNL